MRFGNCQHINSIYSIYFDYPFNCAQRHLARVAVPFRYDDPIPARGRFLGPFLRIAFSLCKWRGMLISTGFSRVSKENWAGERFMLRACAECGKVAMPSGKP